jgi:glucokinase
LPVQTPGEGVLGVSKYLVAMIDGAAVAFAVAEKRATLTLDKVWRGRTADYPTLIDTFQHYLKLHGLHPTDYPFAIAVAGVPRGDTISLANCRWFVSVSGLRAFVRSEPLVLNECAASAWSLVALDRSGITAVGAHKPKQLAPNSTFLLVASGTGLGVATIHVTAEGQVLVLESEGGHSTFAPSNPTEDELLIGMRQKFGHVSYERFLAEPGLGNIYRALAARAGNTGEPPAPEAIVAAARQRTDPIAAESLKVFTGVLASFLGSTTLTMGAWDGVFLTGDILHRMIASLAQAEFRSRLQAKGRMAKLLETVPIALLNPGETQLLGAGAALDTRETAKAAVGDPSPLPSAA